MLVGCRGDGTAPNQLGSIGRPPPPPIQAPSTNIDSISVNATGWLWVMVEDDSGVCIDGAVIEIVSGQGAGFKGTQAAGCDVWDDWEGGYLIYGLVPGDSVRLRASAPGYQDGEKAFLPSRAERPEVSEMLLAKQSGSPSIPVAQPTLDLRPSR